MEEDFLWSEISFLLNETFFIFLTEKQQAYREAASVFLQL